MQRHIPWTDYLLVRLACWCRARMSRPTAYYFDLEAHDRMGRVAEAAAYAAHAGRGGGDR